MARFLGSLAVTALIISPAFGSAANISIEVPGFGNTYTPVPGETFRAEVWIVSDVPMSAWGHALDDGGGMYTIAASVPVLGGPPENYCDVFYPPLIWDNSAGWDPSTGVTWNGGAVTAVNMGALAKPGGANTGFAVWFDLTAPADPAAIPAVITGLDAFVGDLNLENIPTTVSPLVLLPEPSALWLLAFGGLMITRRR
jgi:hypothetical protein